MKSSSISCVRAGEKRSKSSRKDSSGHYQILKFSLKKKFEEHSKAVYSLCFLEDGRLASASYDRTIKIINLTTSKCEVTLKGHTKGINSISLLEDGCLISSSRKVIKIWKVQGKEYQCLATLTGHNDWVSRAIQISQSRIVSSSNDKTIKIWRSDPPYNCIKTLDGHSHWVRSVMELKNKKYIVSAGGFHDYTIRFWNNLTLPMPILSIKRTA